MENRDKSQEWVQGRKDSFCGSIRMILICLVSLRDPGNCNEIGTKFLCVPKLWFRTTCSGFQNSLSKQAQEPEEIKTEG